MIGETEGLTWRRDDGAVKRCPHSGLAVLRCKPDLCDCFDFPEWDREPS